MVCGRQLRTANAVETRLATAAWCGRGDLALGEESGDDCARHRGSRVDAVVQHPEVAGDTIVECMDGGADVMRNESSGFALTARDWFH